MSCEPLRLTVRFLSVLFGLAAIWFPPDPDDFPFYDRLFPKQAAHRDGMEALYKTRKGELKKHDNGFCEILATIYDRFDETEIGFQPDRIVCAGTRGTGRVIYLQHWKGRRSPT